MSEQQQRQLLLRELQTTKENLDSYKEELRLSQMLANDLKSQIALREEAMDRLANVIATDSSKTSVANYMQRTDTIITQQQIRIDELLRRPFFFFFFFFFVYVFWHALMIWHASSC